MLSLVIPLHSCLLSKLVLSLLPLALILLLNRPNRHQLKHLKVLPFILKVILSRRVHRLRWSVFCNSCFLGTVLSLLELFKGLDLALQLQIGLLQVVDILMLGLHDSDDPVELSLHDLHLGRVLGILFLDFTLFSSSRFSWIERHCIRIPTFEGDFLLRGLRE